MILIVATTSTQSVSVKGIINSNDISELFTREPNLTKHNFQSRKKDCGFRNSQDVFYEISHNFIQDFN